MKLNWANSSLFTGAMSVPVFAFAFGIMVLIYLPGKGDVRHPEFLKLFVVHEEPRPGVEYFSTEKFPDIGFIHTKPDFVIKEIESVRPLVRSQEVGMADPLTGKWTQGYETRMAVIVELSENEAKRFADFTSRITKSERWTRILFVLGNSFPNYFPTN